MDDPRGVFFVKESPPRKKSPTSFWRSVNMYSIDDQRKQLDELSESLKSSPSCVAVKSSLASSLNLSSPISPQPGLFRLNTSSVSIKVGMDDELKAYLQFFGSCPHLRFDNVREVWRKDVQCP
jgi:hypothetical protein